MLYCMHPYSESAEALDFSDPFQTDLKTENHCRDGLACHNLWFSSVGK